MRTFPSIETPGRRANLKDSSNATGGDNLRPALHNHDATRF